MKKLFIAVFVAGIVSIFSLSASAAPYQVEVGNYIELNDHNTMIGANGAYIGAGGMVFNINGTNDEWTTFCLQYSSHTSYGEHYYISSIEEGTDDTLDMSPDNWNRMAWLYQNYMMGTLDNNIFNGSSSDQAALQYAFWILTEDFSGIYAIPTIYRQATDNILVYSLAALQGNWTNNGSVMVAVNRGQDVLVYSAAPVPEPATMLLLGTGLIGLAGVGRKKFLK